MSGCGEHLDYVVIGAGVVGLAVAEALSRRAPRASLAVLERHRRFGQETSSHNSEVIHAGIYYQDLPEKARHCLRGREMLYALCREQAIAHRQCGKFIVATAPAHLEALGQIRKAAEKNGVLLEEMPPAKLPEPIRHSGVAAALWSPSSGIVDSHALMARLEALSRERGTIVAYGSTFVSAEEVDAQGCHFTVRDEGGALSSVRTRVLINAAGLSAAKIAAALVPGELVQIRPCRGRYFALSSRWTGRCAHLVYPAPDPAGGLGIHLTVDLSGKCRLGPDVDWSRQGDEPDDPRLYQMDGDLQALQERFFRAGNKLLPDLQFDDLSPDYLGVRPKLYIGGQPHRDFLVRSAHGGATWHLLGIESPGLTAALSLADELARLLI